MSAKKIISKHFDKYDRSAMEAFLQKQSLKGWLLVEVSGSLWKFQRDEPKYRHFSVVYFPSQIKPYDVTYRQRILEFREYCSQTGWQFACSDGYLQFYYNEQEDPIPIETDPKAELENIHKTVLTRKRIVYLCVRLAFLLVLIAIIVMLLRDDLIAILSQPNLLILELWLLYDGLLEMFSLGYYYIWYRQAKKSVEQFGTYKNLKGMRPVIMCLGAMGVVGLFVIAGSAGKAVFLAAIAIIALYKVLEIPLAYLWDWRCENGYYTTSTKHIENIVLFAVITAVIGTVFLRSPHIEIWETEQLAQPPVVEADLSDRMHNHECEFWSGHESIFVSTYLFQQMDGIDNNCLEFQYMITKANMEFLSQLCKKAVLKEYHQIDEAEPELWHAEQVYTYSNAYGNRYVIVYADMVVELRTDWELSSEQISVMGRKFSEF